MTEARWSDERASARLEPDPTQVGVPLQLERPRRGSVGAYRAPLPTVLAERAPAEERERHEAVARRHGEVAVRVRELGVELNRARAADEAAAVEAAAAGEPMPEPRAPAFEAELEQTQRELAALEAALPRSADDLLATVAGEVPAAIEQARERGRAVLAAVDEVLASLAPELVTAEAAFAEAAWLARLLERRVVAPFMGRGGSGRELRLLVGMLGEARGRLEAVLEEQTPAPALETSDTAMWSESHRVRPRTSQPAGDEEAEPEA
jgi:hypothetical protein